VKIDYLSNHREFALLLAELCAAEWQHLYTRWNRDAALRELQSLNADGTIPLCLIAMEEGELLGTVSLVYDDLPGYERLNPWVASLFVLQRHRGKQIGSRLLREAERLLIRNRVADAYLFTESARAFFEKLGWQVFEQAKANGHRVFILRKYFSETNSP
jgi:GNAT superfamily N-acetyltransferase